jgi:hypothetical protein
MPVEKKPIAKPIRYSIMLPADMHAELHRLSDERTRAAGNPIPVAWICREFIHDGLRKSRKG